MHKIKDYFFKPRFFISRFELNLLAIFFISAGIVAGIFVSLEGIKLISAATTPWTQTDWSGGAASGTVTGTVTTYESIADIAVGTVGEASISPTTDWAASMSAWTKRQLLTITNTQSEQTDYQVRIPIPYSGDMQSDFDDIRFTDSGGTELSHWLETKTDSTSAVYWVKIPTLTGTGDTQIYMYYGNSGASSASDGNSTFILFDDFSSGTIDTGKWVVGGTPTFASIVSGELKIGEGSNAWSQAFYAANTFSRSDISFEMKYRWTSANSSYDALMMGWHDGGSGNSYTDLVYGYYNSGTGSCTSGCAVNVYEDSNSRSPISGTWTKDTQYLNRIKMKASGGAVYEQSTDGGNNWITSYSTSYSTESNVRPGITLHSGIHMFDDMRVRKWLTSEPSVVAGSEQSKYVPTASLTSNILDAEFAADWGVLTYTTSGSGGVEVRVRSDVNADMSTATDWASCSAISSGTDLSSTDCVTDTDQYLQYQVTLTPSGASSPVFEDISIAFSASDQVDPTTNASGITMSTAASGGRTVADTGYNNTATPYFSWTAGADDPAGNGLRGYCVYVGTTVDSDPRTTAGILTNSPISSSGTDCGAGGFIVSSTSLNLSAGSYLSSPLASGTTYYVYLRAIDLAGNAFSGTNTAAFSFIHDGTIPTNISYLSTPGSSFSNVVDMFFSWPTSGGTAASDADSGILGYQYQLNGTDGSWLGTDTDSTCGVDYIPQATASYTLTQLQDGDNIVSGNNIVYFRSIDVACNSSSTATYRTGNLSYGGAAPAFDGDASVTITPTTATSNSYGLSWPEATATSGQNVTHYYYMINAAPPSTLATLQSNPTTYIDNGTSRTVSTAALPNVNKGTNTVRVVAIDDASTPNYSPSNVISGTFTLNSSDPDNVGNLVASDSSIKAQEQWNVTLSWTAPSYQGAGNLTYLIYRSSDGVSFSQVGSTTGVSYVDNTPLSTLYYYKVYTKDGAQAVSSGTNAASITPTGKWTTPPTLDSGPDESSITTKKATITWSTNRTSDSKVAYGTESGNYYDEEPSNANQVAAHVINLTNLSPGTTYYYKAKWTDEDGNTGESEEQTFTTSPAPSVVDPQVTSISISSALVEFAAEHATSIKIYYGPSTAFGGVETISTSEAGGQYTVSLTGLTDGTKYYYRINTFDAEGAEYEGDTLSFETLPRPKISQVQIQQVTGTAQTTLLISWQTNTAISSIVTYYPLSDPGQARDEVNVTLKSGAHQVLLRGLLPDTAYGLVVKGVDKVGNQASSDVQTVTTQTDTRPPQVSALKVEGGVVPQTSTAGQESTAQLVISWNTDEPSTSQVEFGEGTGSTYAQKTQEDTNLTVNHLVVISNLTPSKVYHIRALSKDKAGNEGKSIDTVTITPKATKNALDLVLTNLGSVFGFLGR